MSNNSLYDVNELLKRLANGDEAAFAEIFHVYRNKIYTVAYHLTESVTFAEEIVQDVFLKVWLKRETLTTVKQFDAWLFVVARNESYSCLRAIARQEVRDQKMENWLPGQRFDAHFPVEEKEYEQLLREVVGNLPPQQQRVYLLNKEQGLSREEIASQLKISSETVKAHLTLAMRTIRAYCLSRLPLAILLLVTSRFF